MRSVHSKGAPDRPNRRWPRWSRRLGRALIFVLLVYIGVAYVVFPLFWRHYDHMPRLVTGIGPTLRDVNGEKDWYFTDGEMTVGVLSAANAVRSELPVKPSSPSHVRLTNRIWKAFGGLFENLP